MKSPATTAVVRVDLTRRADHPLSKAKFAVFNSGIVKAATYRRDAAALRSARPESVRIDIGWGPEWIGYQRQISVRTGSGFVYDFSELDEIGAFLGELGIRPYWSYCYVPAPYQRPGGDWRDLAEDDTGWVEMVRAYAGGAARRGVRVGYHEVYNEPDLRDERTGEAVFFGGDLADYLDLYRATATAIRKADPDTAVGGPALASVLSDEHWIPAFLDLVSAEDLPLDFFSFHHYGTHSVAVAVEKVLRHLDERPGLAEVEVHLNEYNSYPVDYPRGGLQDGHHLAAALLADVDMLLARPGVTKVSWAQFLDSGHGNHSGMVDIDGARKPVLSAYEFYQSMPTDRCVLHVDGPPEVGGLAGVEPGRARVLLWNRSPREVRVELAIAAGSAEPFDAVELRRIDADHDGTQPEHVPVPDDHTLSLPLPQGGVVLVELTGPGDGEPVAPAGTVRRVRHRYRGRTTTAWADLDERTTTFRLGTAADPDDVPIIGAHLSGCADRITVSATLAGPDGAPVPEAGVTVRVDGPDASAVVDLGARPDGRQGWPSWVSATAREGRTRHPAGSAEIDLTALGAGGAGSGEVVVTVALHGAPAHTFATVRLS